MHVIMQAPMQSSMQKTHAKLCSSRCNVEVRFHLTTNKQLTILMFHCPVLASHQAELLTGLEGLDHGDERLLLHRGQFLDRGLEG